MWFLAYEGDDGSGVLAEHEKLTITGYDAEQDVYNVQSQDNEESVDSLFDSEFTSEDPTAEQEAKPTKKKVKVAPVVDEDEDEEEEEAPAPKKAVKKSAPVVDEDEDEAPVPKKASKKAPVVESDEDEEDEEDEKPVVAKKKAKVQPDPEEDEEVEAPKKSVKKSKKVEEEDEDEEPVEQKKRGRKPKVEEEDDLGEFVQTESVTSTLKRHKGNALNAAKDLAETKERTIFTLGGVLAFVKRNSSYLKIKTEDGENLYEAGLNGFNEYVKEELGIEARSAAYYVDLYEMFSKVTTEAKIAKIGWTKLRELLPLRQSINSDNVDEWLEKAKESTTAELHETVTKSLVDAGDDIHGNRVTAKQAKFSFVVHNDQASIVSEAIDRAKEILGDDASDSAALVHILSEWMDTLDSE